MAKCLNCGKSGFFLKITNLGVCETCHTAIVITIESRFRIFKESAEIIKTTDNPATLKSRIVRIKEQLNIFIDYENKKINIMTPTASEQLELIIEENDRYYADCFQKAFNSLAVNVANMKVKSAQINKIDKFFSLLNDYTTELNNPSALSSIQKKAEKLRDSISVS